MNWRKAASRLAWGSLVIAIVAVSGWWISGRLLDGWLFMLYLPALAVTIYLSGGPHDISPVIGFIAQVIQTFLMIYLIVIGAGAVWYFRRRGANQANQGQTTH